MKQVKWFDREFEFTHNADIFPSIVERLRGTPARLTEKINKMPKAILEEKPENKWSVKEHIGHLIDLETLWQGRLEDILNGEEFLRPTDLENKKTDEANHNKKSIKSLLDSFRKIREKTIAALEKLTETQILKTALHPRLKTPMRAIDLFLFVAEHDDHHLVSIQEILKR